jgi:hypothetical protein
MNVSRIRQHSSGKSALALCEKMEKKEEAEEEGGGGGRR